ncbi:MAG TPA: HAMP domain-containing sensor histidine kinase [Ramlibacter sp.]|uniref:sensor histidine kinase n=1 Tax=Ramlibacter sp. TaxID=1917967 RepID=UPI002ED24154
MADRWHQRTRQRLRHSLKARLVALFLVLALLLAGTFLAGMQKALGIGWRDAAKPLVTDYVDRLAAEIGSPPSVDRARAMTDRLPITVRIAGPQVNWDSDPRRESAAPWQRHEHWRGDEGLLVRSTADGHRIAFGVNVQPWRDRPRVWAWLTLAVLLVLTAIAYKFVRRLLRPLDDIRAGAQRFGRGEFGEAIPVRRGDELGELAGDVNAMASSIHQMLEAKRTLLLAISHELRSPLTRARVHAELLPEGGEAAMRREALLRELQAMAHLVTELLESERLGQGHAALQREPTDLGALVREVTADTGVRTEIATDLPPLPLDRVRMRLLLRNLVDNALRHGAGAEPPLVRVVREPGAGIALTVRDFGPGVDPAVLPQLAEPFYRPDAARERATGGVGLGLYLCRLIAQAHGADFALRNGKPGFEVAVRFRSETSSA